MMLELLMHVCAVFLQCIVLALLFIDDILYNDVSIFDREDDFFAFVMLMIVMLKTVLLLDDCHSSNKEICDEREMYTMRR